MTAPDGSVTIDSLDVYDVKRSMADEARRLEEQKSPVMLVGPLFGKTPSGTAWVLYYVPEKTRETDQRIPDRSHRAVIEAFFEVMDVVVAARDEQDLRALKGLHYHKLQGKRQHQHGLDLTNQFRLVVERREDDNGVYLVIQEIVDYHR